MVKIKKCHVCGFRTEDITPYSEKGKPECRACYRDRTERHYEIVRFYHPSLNKRPRRTGSGPLTLVEAKAHCSDPKTRKEGRYFDGFQAIR